MGATTVVLSAPVAEVVCDNHSGQGARFTLQPGQRLRLESASDPERCVWLSVNEEGKAYPVSLFMGNDTWRDGYRFIIRNDIMAKQHSLEFPAYDDFVDLIMAYEDGDLDEANTARMFADPRCRHLQGHYSSRCTAP